MMLMERKRKRKESTRGCQRQYMLPWDLTQTGVFGLESAKREPTENELLGRCEHVEREGDFILISFALEPAEESGGIEHAVWEIYKAWLIEV